MYTRGKRWFEKEEEKEANCTPGNPWSYILYEQKETIFEELVAILNDKINLALKIFVILHDKKR